MECSLRSLHMVALLAPSGRFLVPRNPCPRSLGRGPIVKVRLGGCGGVVTHPRAPPSRLGGLWLDCYEALSLLLILKGKRSPGAGEVELITEAAFTRKGTQQLGKGLGLSP